MLSFDKPVSDAVASDLNQSKRAQMLRQQAIASGPQGIIASTARGVAGAIPQFMDPINIGSSFIPGVGDARMAAILGQGALAAERFGALRLADGLLNQAARTEATGAVLDATRAGRLVQGSSQGIVGQAALEPLNYGLDQDEHNDWSMGQALGNIAFGGLLGGGLHALIPRARLDAETEPTIQSLMQPLDETQLSNPTTARLEQVSPDTRGSVLNDAVAAVNGDRPNNAESLLQLNEAQNLRDELGRWVQQNDRIQSDQDALLSRAARDDASAQDRAQSQTQAQSVLQQQLDTLRSQHASVSAEAQAARDRWSRGLEDTTPDRIDAIHAEMERAGLPAARRQQLSDELRMLTEGGPTDGHTLEQARTQAQVTGLERQQSRIQKQIARLEKRLNGEPPEAADLTESPAFRAAAARIQSRQDVLHALTHRSLARFARRVGSGASDTDLRTMATRILSGDGSEEAMTQAIRDIQGNRNAPSAYSNPVNDAYVNALRQTADAQGDAANGILRNLSDDDTPEIASARQATDIQTEGAPEVSSPSGSSEDLAQAQAALADVDARITQDLGDEAKAELKEIARERERDEGTAKAFAAAASCMIGRMNNG